MKKRIAMVLAAVFCLLSLAGCGRKGEEKELFDAPAETQPAQSDPGMPTQETSDHIDLSDFQRTAVDNQTGVVAVYAPNRAQCTSYRLKPLEVAMEDALHILCPEDTSRARTMDDHGLVSLNTDNGTQILCEPGRVSLSVQDGEKYTEIETLLQLRGDAYAEEQRKNLDFMTWEEASSQVENMIRALRMRLEPKLEICIGMDHAQLTAYQQELLQTDPYYDEFGEAYELSELDADDDCYYLCYSFTQDGISVYQSEHFPFVSRVISGAEMCPSYVTALISREGIRKFSLMGGYSQVDPVETNTITPAEQVAKQACNRLDLDYFDSEKRIASVCLNYIPVHNFKDDSYEMEPYWGTMVERRRDDGVWVADHKELVFSGFTGGEAFQGN